MLSRNSKARNSKCGPRTERIKDGVSSLPAEECIFRRGVYGDHDCSIDAIALTFFDRGAWTIAVNYDHHHRESYIKRDSRWSSSSRGEEDVAEKDREELCKLKIGRAICVTVILDGRLEQKFFLILINNGHHVREFGEVPSLSLSSRSKNDALILHVYTSNWNKVSQSMGWKTRFLNYGYGNNFVISRVSLSLLNNNSNLIVN